MKYVGYAWNVAWNILQSVVYALIAWYVLGQLHGRPEALIVPILGILYCRQSFIAVATIAMLRGMNVKFNETVGQLKQLGAGSYLTTEPEPVEKLAIEAVGYLIAILGSAAISLQCAWKIYTVLSPQLPF